MPRCVARLDFIVAGQKRLTCWFASTIQLFDTEVARKMTKAPALAPVPKRQPIGNSLFPLATDDKITAERDVGEEEVEEEPVDVVAAMWRF